MAKNSLVPSPGRQTFLDGHGLNESYKMPSAHPAGRDNLSYMHPHLQPLSLTKPWSSVDKTLGEAARHPDQLSRTKTVFPVSGEKQRGAPKPPEQTKIARPGKQAGSIFPGPQKPSIF